MSMLSRLRRSKVAFAGFFLLVAAALLGLYLWSPHATLRITTGPAGGVAQRFISGFMAVTTADHPRVRFQTVEVSDLRRSAKALEEGKVDIAIVRSDVPPPPNGQTLVILRRDVVALALPAGSTIKNVAQLAGKTIAIPASPAQNENSRALDLILNYFNVAHESVQRIFVPVFEIGATLRDRRAAGALAIGPIGPGEVVDVVGSIAKATGGNPKILPIDAAEAISKQSPGFEAVDVPVGAFKAHPPVPNDGVKSLAVTYRFAIPVTTLDAVAGVMARSILKLKSKLMAVTPLANQIEAPDLDEKNPLLPVHPGVAAYLTTGDKSFFQEFQGYFYIIGIPLSLVASFAALVTSFLGNKRLKEDHDRIFRFLVISEEATKATPSELEKLEQEFRNLVAACVAKLVEGTTPADHAPMSLAIEHARRSLDGRKATLRGDPGGSVALDKGQAA